MAYFALGQAVVLETGCMSRGAAEGRVAEEEAVGVARMVEDSTLVWLAGCEFRTALDEAAGRGLIPAR
eukprot:5995602-Lingulodinium_polyedra.AAC.1